MKSTLAGKAALLALAALLTPSACLAQSQDPPGLPNTANSPDSEPGPRPGLFRLLPRTLSGRVRQTLPLTSLFVPAPVRSTYAGPGTPASRPRPGSQFDPGAGGPGISQFGDENFLAGALDVRTGWPFVLLDHYRPRPERLGQVWIVESRDCPQELGTDPWPAFKILTFDAEGRSVRKTPADLFAAVAGRPALIQVQGSPDHARRRLRRPDLDP